MKSLLTKFSFIALLLLSPVLAYAYKSLYANTPTVAYKQAGSDSWVTPTSGSTLNLTYGSQCQFSVTSSSTGNIQWLGVISATNSLSQTLTVSSGGSLLLIDQGDASYNPSGYFVLTITVSKANQAALSVAANYPNIQVDQTATVSTSGGSSSGAVTYSLVSGPASVNSSSGVVTPTGTGTVVVQATKAGDSNYNAISSTVTLHVLAKLTGTISASTSHIQLGQSTTITANATFDNTFGSASSDYTQINAPAGNVNEVQGTGTSYTFTPSSAGTYTFYTLAWTYNLSNPYWETVASTTVSVSNSPSTTNTAGSTSIIVGQTTNITSTYTADTSNGDSLVYTLIGVNTNVPNATYWGNGSYQYYVNWNSNATNPQVYSFTPTSPGTYTFTGLDYTNNNMAWNNWGTGVTVTVSKATPTVSLGSLSAMNVGGSQALSASTNGGYSPTGGFTYSVSATNGATAHISGSSVVIDGVTASPGTVTVRATYNGDSNNNGGNYAEQTVQVNAIAVSLTSATTQNFTYNGSAQGPTVSWSNGSAVTRVTSGSLTQTTAGSYSVSVATNYPYSGSATISYNIAKATPTVSWSTPSAITYASALSGTQLNASASVGGSFAYSPASGSVLGAGTQTLSVNFTPTDTTDYNSVNGTTVNLTVNKATLNVTSNSPSATYTGSTYAGTPGVVYSGFVNGDTTAVLGGTLAYAYSPASPKNVGSYTITPSGLTASNYNFNYVNGTLTINKATLTVTANSPSVTYTGSTYAGTPGVSYSGFLGSDTSASLGGTLAYAYSPASPKTVGAYTITPSGLTSSNYTVGFANGTLTIGAAVPTVSWSTPAAITYGTALSNTQLNASASVGGNYTYTPASGAILGAGTQTLSVHFVPTDTTDYTTPTDTTVNLTVNKASQTVTLSPMTITVDAGQSVTFTASGGNVAYTWGGSATGSGSSKPVTFSTAGTSTVTVQDAGNSNYSASSLQTATITVNSALSIATQPTSQMKSSGTSLTAVSVTAAGGTTPYSYQWYTNTTASTTGATLVSGATSSSYTPLNSAVGTYYYYVVVTDSSSTPVSITSSIPAQTIIAKVVSGISATKTTVSYGDFTNITMTATQAAPGVITQHSMVWDAGLNHQWTGIGTSGWGYASSTTNLTNISDLTNNPIGANSSTKTLTYTPTFLGSTVFRSWSYNNSNPSAQSSAPLTITTIASTPIVQNWSNKSISPTSSGTYIVQASDLTAAFINAYSASFPAPVGTVTYSDQNSNPVTAGTVLTAGVTYTITATVPSETNYNTGTATATWTLATAPQPTLALVASLSMTYPTAQTLSTAGGAGTGTVTYTVVSGPGSLSGTTLTPTATGTIVVRATKAADAQYNAASSMNVSISVNAGNPVITWTTPTAITYGTALTNAQLNASASVLGNYTYTPALGAVLSAGVQTLSVHFVPTDSNYNTPADTTVSLTVNKATLTVTAKSPTVLYTGSLYAGTPGVTYSGFVGTETSAVLGGTVAYAYSPASTINVGSYSITPSGLTSSNYNLNMVNGTLTIGSVTPTVTWSTPAAITYGTPLTTDQLNATASISGTYTYTPALGTVLNAGNPTLSVHFVPTDSNYTTPADTTVALTVYKAASTVSVSPTSATLELGQSVTLTATSTTGNITWSGAATGSNASVTITPSTLDNLSATVFDNGDANHTPSQAVSVPITVTKRTDSIGNITASSPSVQVTDTITIPATTANGVTITYAITSNGVTVPGVWNGNVFKIARRLPSANDQLDVTATSNGDTSNNPVTKTTSFAFLNHAPIALPNSVK